MPVPTGYSAVDAAGDEGDIDGALQRSPWQHVKSQLLRSNLGVPPNSDSKRGQVRFLSVLHFDIVAQLR